ncbi:unnamed protein product, partial [Oncorhynchus mykiss]
TILLYYIDHGLPGNISTILLYYIEHGLPGNISTILLYYIDHGLPGNISTILLYYNTILVQAYLVPAGILNSIHILSNVHVRRWPNWTYPCCCFISIYFLIFFYPSSSSIPSINLSFPLLPALPGYSSWRGLCGLSVPNTTSDLAGILGNPGLAEKFLLLYGTSQNIDVWVGAISEPPLPGGRVGPLLACLLAKQFRALRDGDRFWWEREAVFTSTQRAQLHTVSLSRIICDNTHITRVPSDPFSRTVSPEDMLACSHPLIPHLNLSAWKEPDTDPSCGPIPRLQSGFSLLCDSVIYYQCGPGYQLIGPSSVTCDPNSYQWSPAPPICHDVDECADQPTPCPQNTDCLNTPGSYMCTGRKFYTSIPLYNLFILYIYIIYTFYTII